MKFESYQPVFDNAEDKEKKSLSDLENKNESELVSKKELALDNIMTAAEYSEIRHDTPYVFDVENGDKSIYYFGSKHTHDSSDLMFEDMQSAFESKNPEVVLVEGLRIGEDKKEAANVYIKEASAEDLIAHFGEAGMAIKLAVENNIEWSSPEPDDRGMYDNLLDQGFAKEEIFVWYVLRLLPQYNRLSEKSGFESYAQKFIDNFQTETEWQDFDYAYERVMELAQSIVGREIDPENEAEAADLVDPIPWSKKLESQTVLNRVAQESLVLRDREIVSGIADSLQQHNKVFVVYGASHAVMQERAVRKLME